jgi:RNA polymerase sigma-70 factor (ECF subfamily)
LEKSTQSKAEYHINEEAAALIRKIREGDVSSLATLYDKTSRLLFGLILNILGDRGLAEEALLDVYTHIGKEAAACDTGHLPIVWLMSVARTRAIAKLHWRKQSRKKRRFPAANPDSSATVAPEEQKLARSAWGSLIPMQQEILDWIYYSGLSCSEIAAQIGKPLGAVKTHAYLGLGKLSETLRPIFENDPEATGEAH